MKKTFFAALASLMLAGAISAASSLNTDNLAPGAVVIAGDGTSPFSLSAAPAADMSDLQSHNK